MEYMGEYKEKFEKLRDIKLRYGMDTEEVDEIINGIDNYRVNTPVIGNFSTGKSSMLNAIIEKPLLSVDITPETAVPTEIYYGNNRVLQYDKTGVVERRIEELPLKGLTVQTTDLVKIEYDNEFLKKIRSVNIVDLPGFDTSIELHNRAIDQYLPNSLAYLLVVSSDEPVLKESISDFLRELKAYNMPVYVVITKSNRLDEEELEECRQLLKKLVSRIYDQDDVTVACVDAYGNVKVDELKDILIEIQGKTGEIFVNKYSKLLRNESRYPLAYLEDRIDKECLSTSRLEQEQEKLEKKMQEITVEIEREKNNFDRQAKVCINTIRERVRNDLESSAATISAMLESGADISDKINAIVRRSVRIGINTEFEPKLKKYVEHIAEMIQIEFPSNEVLIANISDKLSTSIIQDSAKTVLPVVLAGVGAVLAGPVIAVIGGVAGIVADTVMNVRNTKKKQHEIDVAATNLINEVAEQTVASIESEIMRYIATVNEKIEKDVLRQKEMLKKSIQDVKIDISIEESNRAKTIEGLEADLKILKEFRADREEAEA